MLLLKPLDFVKNYISELEKSLQKVNSDYKLSLSQKLWMGICLSGIILTGELSWTCFERLTAGFFGKAKLSWMFRKSKIMWTDLLKASINAILRNYNITKGNLIIDDSERQRSKNTTTIPFVSTAKDKQTGGFKYAQQLVFLVLVTNKITIPVGIDFYMPDPELTDWYKQNKELKSQGVKSKDRPSKPKSNPLYPTKQKIAAQMVTKFKANFPNIKINTISADALYGDIKFFTAIHEIYPKAQIISQLKKNQLIKYKGKYISLLNYFKNRKGITLNIKLRGHLDKEVTIVGIRAVVKSHGIKRYIVALKYEGEEEYRYLVASDITWRMADIITAYSLRWLVEVVIQDWKAHSGWNKMAKQPGEEGSYQGVILSLLADHCYLLNTTQKALVDSKLPAVTAGSLRRALQKDAFISAIKEVVASKNPQEYLGQLKESLDKIVRLESSTKHLTGTEYEELDTMAA